MCCCLFNVFYRLFTSMSTPTSGRRPLYLFGPVATGFQERCRNKTSNEAVYRGRGPTAREVFTPLTEKEQAISRINVSNRQGGRGPDRARLRQELGCLAPPRPCCRPPTTQDAPPGYLPAGYRSPASEMTSSSLSLDGLTNDVDADLDEIDLSVAAEFAGPCDEWMASFPDLATVATVGASAPNESLSTTDVGSFATHSSSPVGDYFYY